jgi:hypothetical protein
MKIILRVIILLVVIGVLIAIFINPVSKIDYPAPNFFLH